MWGTGRRMTGAGWHVARRQGGSVRVCERLQRWGSGFWLLCLWAVCVLTGRASRQAEWCERA